MPARPTLFALLLACFLSLAPVDGTQARPAPAQVAHRAVAAGFAIPLADGSAGGWIGSYRVAGRRVYCADPRREGPGPLTRYRPARPVTSWRRLDGSPVPRHDLRRTAWVLSHYGDTGRPVQAAAVDTVVYALTAGGPYAFGARRSEQRLRQSGHHDAIHRLAARYLAESRTGARAPRLHVATRPSIAGGRVTVSARVLTAGGRPVPGVTFAITYRGVTRRVAAGRDGSVRVRFPAGPAGRRSVRVRATGVPSSALSLLVPTSLHQRMFVSGATTTLRARSRVRVLPYPSTPGYVTQVSATATRVGDRLTDRIRVTGVRADRPLHLWWALFGPFPGRPTADSCTHGHLAAEGGLTVSRPGVVTSPPVTLPAAGWFTYQESNGAVRNRYRAHHSRCGLRTESTFTDKLTPTLTTRASAQRAQVGDTLTDSVVVAGLGAATGNFDWRLLGPRLPYAGSCAALDWSGAVTAASGSVTVTGDGTYPTPGVQVRRPGCFTYVESLAETATTHPADSAPGQPTESTLTRAHPRLHTRASARQVTTGSLVRDTVVVRQAWPGLHQRVVARLYGPFASRAEITCTGTPYATAQLRVRGNGTFHTSPVRLREPGVYAWQESLAADVLDTAATHPCGQVRETTRAHRPPVPVIPEVPTGFSGGQQQPRFVRRPYVSPPNAVHRVAGNRLVVPRLRISAPVDTVRLDDGVMAVPNDPHRVGWLRVSAHASDVIGTSVIAGHVSDRVDRPGALWGLRAVRLGDPVTWVVGGRRHDFVVTRIARYDRARVLPPGLFRNRGRHVLRLVTCARRIVSGNHWHYRQNLVVTASPVPTSRVGLPEVGQ